MKMYFDQNMESFKFLIKMLQDAVAIAAELPERKSTQ